MKIDPLSPARNGGLRKSERGQGAPSGGGFARALAGGAEPATAPSSPTQISRVEGLFALQEVPDPEARRRRAVQRGLSLLDQLDRIRLAMLSGSLSPAELRRLAQVLAQEREALSDPALAEVLAEVELRAAVELAKYEA